MDDQVRRLHGLLQHFTYRGGWEFNLIPLALSGHLGYDAPSGVLLEVRCVTQDRVKVGHKVTLVDTLALPVGINEQEFMLLLWERIRRLEDHERLEWMRMHEHPVWEPHTAPVVGTWPFGEPQYGPHGEAQFHEHAAAG